MATARSFDRSRILKALLGVTLGAAAGASAASCSILNSFAPVAAFDAGTTSSSASSSGAGGASSASSSASSVASSGSASSSSSSGAGTGGSDGGVTHGIVLVAGRLVANQVTTSTRVFSILDAQTGAELNRYPLSIIAATQDPVTDTWYLFEAPTLPPEPGATVALHVGNIDPHTGAWTEATPDGGVTGVPAIIDAIDLAVLDKRLVYAAFDPAYSGSGIAPIGLAILDTSNATSPTPAFSPDEGFVSGLPTFFGFIATSTVSNVGGQVNLITQTCANGATECTLNRNLITIPNQDIAPVAPQPDNGITIIKGANGTAASWAVQLTNGPYDLVAAPPNGADAGATLTRYSSTSTGVDTTLTFTATPGGQFGGMAVSECYQAALIADRSKTLLYAVPLSASANDLITPAQASLSPNATVVYLEPVTQTVVMPFQPADATYHLDAWQLASNNGNLALNAKTGVAWTPPQDIAVDAVAIRHLNPSLPPCSQP